MSKRVLEFENVGKLYTLGKVGTGTLSRDLTRWWHISVLKREDPYMKIGETNKRHQKGESEFVWALQNIDLTVNKGDVVGIIGKNGSGKSTLLKLVSRITAPSTGLIKTKGKVASLLEVGTGFHPDLTGRDNIYMNGAILGMTKQEINRKFDEIVDFSGVARYIDTPVKRYSSGMSVRLGFAVAAHLEPDILIVDEVLAVGDAEFQKKAIGKMKSVSSEEGRTVLFVSHNMNSVTQLCNRGIILQDGHLIYDGDVNKAVSQYIGGLGKTTSFEGIDGDETLLYLNKAKVSADGIEVAVFRNSQAIDIDFEVTIRSELNGLIAGFNLYSQYDYPLARADFNDVNHLTYLKPGKYNFSFRIPERTLAPGSYRISFDVAKRKQKRYTTPASDLYFDIVSEPYGFGNVYPNVMPIKNSLIHADWLTSVTPIT